MVVTDVQCALHHARFTLLHVRHVRTLLRVRHVRTLLHVRHVRALPRYAILNAVSAEDWHSSKLTENPENYVIPSVGIHFTFFNSKQPEFTELPRYETDLCLQRTRLLCFKARHFFLDVC